MTKAQMVARIAELERQRDNGLAVIDALSDARGIGGVRVVGDVDGDGTHWTVCAIGRGVTAEQGARIAAVFVNTLGVARGLTLIAAEAIVSRDGEEGA